MGLSPYQERILACMEGHERAIVVHKERTNLYAVCRYWLSAELKRVIYDPTTCQTDNGLWFWDDTGRRTNTIEAVQAEALITEGHLVYTILPEVAELGYRYGRNVELYTLPSRNYQAQSGLDFDLSALNLLLQTEAE